MMLPHSWHGGASDCVWKIFFSVFSIVRVASTIGFTLSTMPLPSGAVSGTMVLGWSYRGRNFNPIHLKI